MRRALALAALLIVTAAALAAACDEHDAPPRIVAGIVHIGGAGAPVHVLVRNDSEETATFDVILVDRLEGRGVAREHVPALAPKASRTLTFEVPGDAARLRAVALPVATHAAAAHHAMHAVPLDATTRTGIPPGIARGAWNSATGIVRATTVAPAQTRFELNAAGLVPDGVYSLWWVDGIISPTAGPVVAGPQNVTRAADDGTLRVDVVADFAVGAHDRLALVFHADRGAADPQRDMIGKTIFAHLLGSLPQTTAARRAVELAAPR